MKESPHRSPLEAFATWIAHVTWWPEITDAETARRAALSGVAAATLCAVTTGAFAVLGLFGVSRFSLLDAGLFTVIAWGIYRMSRAWAIAGLVIYVSERIVGLRIRPGVFSVIAIIFIVLFIGGIRGTFAYHRFRRGQ